MSAGQILLAATLVAPLALLAACASAGLRARMCALLPLAPVPGLAAALFASGTAIDLPPALLSLHFALDPPAALLLGAASLLWIAAGMTVPVSRPPGFVAWWLLTLSGSLGVFIAGDLVSFYLLFSTVSLAAFGLITADGGAVVRRSGFVYLALALLGEAFLLLAFVLLAAGTPDGSILITDTVAALPASPWRVPAMALLLFGFGAKIGALPFHFWMPLTYRAAPVPAAAALSGAAVKAGVIGLIRFLPLATAMPDWGGIVTAVGFCSAFYGVAVGITQRNPKTILAYSSISQMGVIAAVFGMGWAAGDGGSALAAGFYGAHHTLVKGGLFLAIGLGAGRRAWPVLVPAAVLALGLAGLPLSGGAMAKYAVKDVFGSGTAGLLATLSSVGTALLMTHFLFRLAAADDAVDRTGRGVAAWLAMAAAAVVLPWVAYVWVLGGDAGAVLSASALWEAGWPVLLGGAVAVGLHRSGLRLPALPEGDIADAVVALALRLSSGTGRTLAGLDALLRQWAVAATALLALAGLLGALLLTGR
jgi:formate hydrogenlyase subunit 3/multisubunit Na+/H+ antiporter MnhD subunit